jgi:hypothetical protein
MAGWAMRDSNLVGGRVEVVLEVLEASRPGIVPLSTGRPTFQMGRGATSACN